MGHARRVSHPLRGQRRPHRPHRGALRPRVRSFQRGVHSKNGTKLYAGTRHQPNCDGARLDLALGTEGRCNLMGYTMLGQHPWKWDGRRTVMHQLEHDAMYAALRDGDYINNGEYMARQSAYPGKALTWEQILNSKEDLTPPSYRWDQKMPEPPVAIPGKTKFL